VNTEFPLLDPDGRPRFALGVTAFRTFAAPPYTVALDWVEDEPAMVLWTANAERGAAFAICLSSIGKYALPDGKPNPEGVTELYRSLPDFGRARTEAELRFLTDIVLRYTPDLLHMPPQPRDVALHAKREAMFEITESDEPQGGKVLGEVVI